MLTLSERFEAALTPRPLRNLGGHICQLGAPPPAVPRSRKLHLPAPLRLLCIVHKRQRAAGDRQFSQVATQAAAVSKFVLS